MSVVFSLMPVLIIGGVSIFALFKGVDVFGSMLKGAGEGLRTSARMLPALITLLPAVYMLRASGALDILTRFCSPALKLLGIPPETAQLIFLGPVSGSGSLALASDVIARYGADSLIGRTAAVMIGSTETTFYVIAVYLGAVGIRKNRRALVSALCADAAGFILASWVSRWLWG